MFLNKLKNNAKNKKTSLCLGIDPDISKIPHQFPKNISGLRQFLFEYIDLTANYCIAYKPNISFFEGLGLEGLALIKELCAYIPDEIPIIIDGKRGDIGNTSKKQAQFIYDVLGADATTLHPCMGLDSLKPFFEYKDKYNFVLVLTSNPSAGDFEKQKLENGDFVYQKVAKQLIEWNKEYQNIGFVVGATQNELESIRRLSDEPLFLIPGVGSQGGSYQDALKGKNKDDLVLINVSRSAMYASQEKDFKEATLQSIQSL
jgi:orotidine-5'-phosphate decarboxylase